MKAVAMAEIIPSWGQKDQAVHPPLIFNELTFNELTFTFKFRYKNWHCTKLNSLHSTVRTTAHQLMKGSKLSPVPQVQLPGSAVQCNCGCFVILSSVTLHTSERYPISTVQQLPTSGYLQLNEILSS